MTNKNRKLIGILLLVVPTLTLTFTLAAYAVVTFVFSSIATATMDQQSMLQIPYVHAAALTVENPSSPIFPAVNDAASIGDTFGNDEDGSTIIANLIRVFLGFVGILCVFGIMFGTPIGIYLLATSGNEGAGIEHRRMKDLNGLAKVLIVLLVVSELLSLLAIVRPYTAGLGSLFALIPSVVFLFWIGRSANNFELITKKQLQTSPTWLVWGHVAPFYNAIHRLITYPGFWKEVVAHSQLDTQSRKLGTVAMWVVCILPITQIVFALAVAIYTVRGVVIVSEYTPPIFITYPSMTLSFFMALATVTFVWFVTKALESKS